MSPARIPPPAAAEEVPAPPPRLRVVDLLRFVAAAAVVLFHFTARDHGRWAGGLPSEVFPHASAITRYGYLGVHLFFVISGFVILMSAWNRPVGSFVASRVSRLYPAFWAAVLLTASLRFLWPGFEARSPAEVLVNLTMLQDPLGVPRVDGVYWTLWVELQFYLLICLFIRVGLTERRVLALAAAAPVVTAPLTLLSPHLTGRWTLVEWLPLFCAGMVICLIYRSGSSRARWSVLALNVVAAMLTSAATTPGAIDAVSSGTSTSPAWVAGGVVLCVALVLLATLAPRVRDVDWRGLTLLGLVTYPLYLTHEYLGWAAIEVLSPRLGRNWALLLAIAACVAVAVMLHLVAERPVQRPLRQRLERLLGPPSPARTAPREAPTQRPATETARQRVSAGA
ncbi:acyltransferase family protein [Cellulomonas timonensis]|uniref:acyltransferase family protein n=1 Tax=Cellulomonas timonensis TaxID=1689271 RepID=UPI0009EE4F90|nr:acyltransferase [Cellulomonas timonensis]